MTLHYKKGGLNSNWIHTEQWNKGQYWYLLHPSFRMRRGLKFNTLRFKLAEIRERNRNYYRLYMY